jgi:hypothetical protein
MVLLAAHGPLSGKEPASDQGQFADLSIRARDVAMIDDPAMVARLMDQLQADLPIPAYPSKEVVRTLRQRGTKISADRLLSIRSVLYLGDEGGITCDVTPPQDVKTPILVSLTHLRLPTEHPLSRDVRAYQRERVKRIAESQE